MQDVTLKITPAERALIRRALPNFVNFMRFLHPGQACAAKFASSTAELGWDGSLLHCKSPGWVVPSFGQRLAKTLPFSLTILPRERRKCHSFRSGRPIFMPQGCDMDSRTAKNVNPPPRVRGLSGWLARLCLPRPPDRSHGLVAPRLQSRNKGSTRPGRISPGTWAGPWCSQRPCRIGRSSAPFR